MDFIVVDDSKLDCFIAEKIIKNTGNCRTVKSFLQASEALNYIRESNEFEPASTIILVDIQMPVMNGFDFIEEFEKFNSDLTDKLNLFIISSSINENDINKAFEYPRVIQFINKPLTSSNLKSLLQNLENKDAN